MIASSLATRSCLSHLDFLAGGGKSSEGCTPDEADVDDGGCTLKKLTNSSALIVAEEMIMRSEGRIRRILGDAGSVTGLKMKRYTYFFSTPSSKSVYRLRS